MLVTPTDRFRRPLDRRVVQPESSKQVDGTGVGCQAAWPIQVGPDNTLTGTYLLSSGNHGRSVEGKHVAGSSAQAAAEGLCVECGHVPGGPRRGRETNRYVIKGVEYGSYVRIGDCRCTEIASFDAAIYFVRLRA